MIMPLAGTANATQQLHHAFTINGEVGRLADADVLEGGVVEDS